MSGLFRVAFPTSALTVAVLLSACTATTPAPTAVPATSTPAPTAARAATPTTVAQAGTSLGDSAVGKQLVTGKGCIGCHTIPGVPGATSTVGPSLGAFASRPQIAGTLANSPDNLQKWLKNPPAVKPGTTMPSLGLSDKEVADISAFLYALK